MFTNGTGYQFHGGVFYNVAGDVNLQHHHRLTIEDRRRVVAPALQAPTSGPKDVKRLPTVQAGEFDGRNAESEDDLTGEARDSRRGMTAATAPYNASVPNAVASSDDDRLEEGHSTQYREAFHLPPMPSTQGATFFSANNVNTAQNIIYRHGESGIDILHRAVALEALYDSAESFMQRRCHPDTRKELLDDLYRWATQNDSAQPICWLHGPAGAGKSAVMQTLCEKLQRTSRLGGAFFFKRGHATRGNPRALFVTLAYQLALNNCELNPPISHVVKHDPSIVGRSMDAQLRQLIIEPCKSLKHSPAPILLLDGLDECDTHDAQLEILRLIGSVVRQYQNKFRIIVASRPEADIRDSLEMPSFAGILHSVNIEQSFDDVRTYLCDEFTRIHREHKHTMGGVPIPWPSTEILERLVYKSSGYFIYASTVVKFVDDKKFHPIDRLTAVVNLSHTPSEAPFAPLDQLYIQILSGVPPRFHLTLGDLLQSYTLLEKMRSPKKIEGLLELQPGVVYLILRSLRSVIEVSDDTISVYHASFLDFLQDPQRSSHFHLGLENRMNITRAVIKALPTDSYGGNTLLNLSLVDLGTCLASVPSSARRSLRPHPHCQSWSPPAGIFTV